MTTEAMLRPIVACACCGTKGPHSARGLIRPCYMRHRKLGTLDQFPVDSEATLSRRRQGARKAVEKHMQKYAARLEDYAELQSWQETREQAATRLGVCKRTTFRYDRALRRVAMIPAPPVQDTAAHDQTHDQGLAP